jgi:hypothetical protein
LVSLRDFFNADQSRFQKRRRPKPPAVGIAHPVDAGVTRRGVRRLGRKPTAKLFSPGPEREAHCLVDSELDEIEEQADGEAGAADEEERDCRAETDVVRIFHAALVRSRVAKPLAKRTAASARAARICQI